MSFVDMLFGGNLASILVCAHCNKISVTYEDFNDLSLSIKPEDYLKERKRDRFKSLAKKLRFRPKELSTPDPAANDVRGQRASSVPASPIRRSMDPPAGESEPPVNVDHRRRSFDHTPADRVEERREALDAVADLVEVVHKSEAPPVDIAVKSDEPVHEDGAVEGEVKQTGHVSFAESPKSKGGEGEKKDAAWGRLGRRISVTMGMAKKDKRRTGPNDVRGPQRTKDSEGSRAPSEERPPAGTPIPRIPLSDPIHNSPDVGALSDAARNAVASPGPISASTPASTTSPALSPALNLVAAFPNLRRNSATLVAEKYPKESRPAKPSREESAYLRRILADVHPSSPSAFSMLHQALSGGNPSGASQSSPALSAQALLIKLGHLPGVEECLRLFTAVEVMDGDNMVGCHRCWKIANGTYKPRHRPADNEPGEDSEDSQESPVVINAEDVQRPQILRRETADSSANVRDYVSSASDMVLSQSAASSSLFLHDTASISSAPTTMQSIQPATKPIPTPLATGLVQSTTPPIVVTPEAPISSYGGLPIPLISTTAPDTPTPNSEADGAPLLEADGTPTHKDTLLPPSQRKRRASRRSSDIDDSSITSDDEGYDSASDASADGSIYSDASSVASPFASPSASPRASAEKLPLSTQTSLASGESGRRPSRAKGSRSEQVVLRRTYKRYLIATPPPILVIHLKRFQQISKSNPYAMAFSGGFKKLDDFVAFPEYLDLAPFLAPKKEDFGLGRRKHKVKAGKESECMYRLYAVVVHIGNMVSDILVYIH